MNPIRVSVWSALGLAVLASLALFSTVALSPMAGADELRLFPENFKWCVATSAHQIEGNNSKSDWWKWEQDAGRIRGGETSGATADHWNRVSEDIALMRELRIGQYRFSVEWAKIQPKPGTWDESALAHYREEIRELRAAGIEPMITLNHFTLPLWVAGWGGWEWERIDQAFADFALKVYQELGADVRDWITINEPLVVLLGGYVEGVFPPGLKRPLSDLESPLVGMLRAHAKAYAVLHQEAEANHRVIRVGMAHHLRIFDPKNRWNPLDHMAAKYMDESANWAVPRALESGRLDLNIPFVVSIDRVIDGLKSTQDFFGVNYYSRDLVELAPFKKGTILRSTRAGAAVSDLGWEIYPEGFYRVLMGISSRFPHLKIAVTENGVADSSDRLRSSFIRDHVEQMHRAIVDGAAVESYCYWSLIDNFEWAEGFAPRFGLYEVDYATFERKPRASVNVFSQIASQNGF